MIFTTIALNEEARAGCDAGGHPLEPVPEGWSLAPIVNATGDDELALIADRIRAHIRRTTADIVECGRDLIAARKKLEHGAFLKWIVAEFGMTDRTARNYINAAEWANDKLETVSVLPPTIVYILSAPTTPQAIKERVVADLDAGRPVDHRAIKREVRQARWEANNSRSIADIEVERKLRRAKRKGTLTPRAKKRIERERRKQQDDVDRLEGERQEAAGEIESILNKLLPDDIRRLRELVDQHGDIVERALRQPREAAA